VIGGAIVRHTPEGGFLINNLHRRAGIASFVMTEPVALLYAQNKINIADILNWWGIEHMRQLMYLRWLVKITRKIDIPHF
jgi:hypothetical protein